MMRFEKHVLTFCAALVSLSLTWGESAGAAPPTSPPDVTATRETMKGFLQELVALKKFFVSEDQFIATKNEAEIARHLKEFSRLARQSAHDPLLNQDQFKFSRYVFEDQIVDAERVFRLGRKSYARWQLNAAVSACMSCHAQYPSPSQPFNEFTNPKIFSSPFDKAEFLFATRSFERAFDAYGDIIKGYSKNGVDSDQVEIALKRQLAYYSRIKRNPEGAIATLKQYQKQADLPEYLKRDIERWIGQFQEWTQKKSIDPTLATDAQIIEFAKQELSPIEKSTRGSGDVVTSLRVSGILFEYLRNNPETKAAPQILYWLAISDRSLGVTSYSPLTNMYLRECILRYPADPMAAKCMDFLEEETNFGYTGSAGTELPVEVKQDLQNLRKFIKSKGKLDLRKN